MGPLKPDDDGAEQLSGLSTSFQPVGTAVPNAAQPDRNSGQPGRTATPHPTREPGRIAVRSKLSREHSVEPPTEQSSYHPRPQPPSDAAARLQAWQGNQSAEVIQNRIAKRLGSDGWLILGDLNEADLNRLKLLESHHQLDDETLRDAIWKHLHRLER